MFFRPFKKMLNNVKKLVLKILSWFIVAFTLLSSACLTYILIYNILIPEISYKRPLNFVFEDCGSSRCERPMAQLDLQSNPNRFNFRRGEAYEVKINLLVPETDTNYDLGMFVMHVKFQGEVIKNYYNKKEYTLLSERKSTMLRYRSPLMRTISSLVYSPLILLGINEEAQTISTTLVDNYVINRHETVMNIFVWLNSHKLDIYEAHIIIRAKLNGFRYFMFNYPFTCFIAGAIFLLFPNLILYFTITSNSFENSKKRISNALSNINRLAVTTTEKSTDTETLKGSDDDMLMTKIPKEIEENPILLTSGRGSESSRGSSPTTQLIEQTAPHPATERRNSQEDVGTEDEDEGSIEILSSDISYDMCALSSCSSATSGADVVRPESSSHVEDLH